MNHKQCGRAGLQLLLLAVALLQATCVSVDKNTIGAVKGATDALNNAAGELSRQPGAWSAVATRLLTDLEQQRVPAIKAQVESLVTRAAATAGAEFRCSADFVGTRLKQNLKALATALAGGPSEPVEPAFCQVDPLRVDLAQPPAGRVIAFYGYDMDLGPSGVKAYLVDESGAKTELNAARSTHYLLQLDLSRVPFACTSKLIEFSQEGMKPLYQVPVLQKQMRSETCIKDAHERYRGKNCFGSCKEACKYTSIDNCLSTRCDAECKRRNETNPKGHPAIGDACSTSGAFWIDCHQNFCPSVPACRTDWCSDTSPLRRHCLEEAEQALKTELEACQWVKDCRAL